MVLMAYWRTLFLLVHLSEDRLLLRQKEAHADSAQPVSSPAVRFKTPESKIKHFKPPLPLLSACNFHQLFIRRLICCPLGQQGRLPYWRLPFERCCCIDKAVNFKICSERKGRIYCCFPNRLKRQVCSKSHSCSETKHTSRSCPLILE